MDGSDARTSRDLVPVDLATVLDPAWLTSALDGIGTAARVISVEEVDRSATLAQKVRFRATIEGGDGRIRTMNLCAKAHFDDGPGTLLTEAHVYRELRPQLGLRGPHPYYAGIDDSTRRAMIIMDDVVAEGATFLSAFVPYSVSLARDSLAQLARLHAATWEQRAWGSKSWLTPLLESMPARYSTTALQTLLDDGRAVDLPGALRDAAKLQAALRRTADRKSTCVIHGDTHSGNAYLDRSGRVCWLDWQITQWGHWSIDVSYHLATVLDIADRRAHESDLLGHYLEELAANGASPPSWDEAWEHYATGFCWGYFLWVITTISSREVVLIHIPRLGAALTDHESFRRLGVDA